MNTLQKNANEKIAKSKLDDGKIRLDGKLGVGMRVTIPGTVEGGGAAKFSFKLPTWLTLDIFRRVSQWINQDHEAE